MKNYYIPEHRNPGNHIFILNLLVVTIAIVLHLAASSCNPAKIASKKDGAALERVKAKRSLLDSLLPVVRALYPDNKDTIITTKTDTISKYDTTTTFIRDTMLLDGRIDTVLKVVTKINNITKTNTVQIPDLKGRAMDAQTMANQDKVIYQQAQTIVDIQGQNTELKKERNSWLWYFIFACVGFGISNGIWVYVTFFKKSKII
jgi:hypothetical protein